MERIRLKAEHTVEFDGFIQSAVELIPVRKTPSKLMAFRLVIPLKSSACSLYQIGTGEDRAGGSIPEEGFRSADRGGVWVGSERRGLFFAEEDARNFFDYDSNRRWQLYPGGEGEMLLRINFVSRPLNFKKPIKYVFFLMATPVKPLAESWRSLRLGYLDISRGPDFQYVNQGIRLIYNFESYNGGWPGYPLLEEKYRRTFYTISEMAHRDGASNIVYLSCNEFDSRAPEMEAYFPEWRAPGATSSSGLERVCLKSSYADFLLWGLGRTLEEGKIDGVFLDYARPILCDNPLHPCGYADSRGKRFGSYNILAGRDFLKRLYVMFHEKARYPHIMTNGRGVTFITQDSFADSVVGGEEYASLFADGGSYLKDVPLDVIRATSAPWQWGIKKFWLPTIAYNKPANYRRRDLADDMLTMLLLNDIEAWLTYVKPEPVKRWWKGKDNFGMDDAEIIGYWQSAPFAKSSDPDIKVSIFRKSRERKILLAVANLSPEKKKIKLRLDLERLGLNEQKTGAKDSITGKPVSMVFDTLSFEIEKRNYRMIVLESPR